MGLIQKKNTADTKIAEDMLELGLEYEQICMITGLSKEEIEELEKTRKNS